MTEAGQCTVILLSRAVEGVVLMPFDDTLAGGIRDVLAHRLDIKEKKMFGGIGFSLNGNMLVGVLLYRAFATSDAEKKV